MLKSLTLRVIGRVREGLLTFPRLVVSLLCLEYHKKHHYTREILKLLHIYACGVSGEKQCVLIMKKKESDLPGGGGWWGAPLEDTDVGLNSAAACRPACWFL